MHLLSTLFATLAATVLTSATTTKQCGAVDTKTSRYDPSGYYTSLWTQNACQEVSGTITGMGNAKCCAFEDLPSGIMNKGFNDVCGWQFHDAYKGLAQGC